MAEPQFPQNTLVTARNPLRWLPSKKNNYCSRTSVSTESGAVILLHWPFDLRLILRCEDVCAERASRGLLAIPTVAQNLVLVRRSVLDGDLGLAAEAGSFKGGRHGWYTNALRGGSFWNASRGVEVRSVSTRWERKGSYLCSRAV